MSGNNERRLTPREAREQAAEATGFLASVEIVVGDDVYEIPQRGLLDDEQRDRMNELELESETWDREPDIVMPDGTARPGPLKVPYRRGGKLIKPSYPVRVAVALWGEERYARYKAAGGRASDVTATLARLDRRIEERERVDPKSEGSDHNMGAGAEPD